MKRPRMGRGFGGKAASRVGSDFGAKAAGFRQGDDVIRARRCFAGLKRRDLVQRASGEAALRGYRVLNL